MNQDINPHWCLVHYYFTPKEMDIRAGKGPGTHEHDSALCGNGSFHFQRSKDKSAITCPQCREKMGLDKCPPHTLTPN
jgi:hypothetical protein